MQMRMPHDVDFIASSFGGGWLFVAPGKDAGNVPFILESIMGEPDVPQMACGGRSGWMVEPEALADIAEELKANGLWVEETA